MGGGPKKTFKMMSVNEKLSSFVYNTTRMTRINLSVTTIIVLQTIMVTCFGNMTIGKDATPDIKLYDLVI